MNDLNELARRLRTEVRIDRPEAGPDLLDPRRFTSIVRGTTTVQNTGLRRECKIELLLAGASRLSGPAALFGCSGAGWLDTKEVAMLNTGQRILSWRRIGRRSELAIDDRSVGRIHLGWFLRHAYVGSGRVSVRGNPFCTFILPILGPSSPQPNDCCGRFILSGGRGMIRFVIQPKDVEGTSISIFSALSWGLARLRGAPALLPTRMAENDGTIFYPSDRDRLAGLADDERLILLGIAVWPWSLYKGGG